MFRISTLIYVVPAILISVTLHEMAHGYVSYKLGDPTPKLDGRLSLNAGFGWARPVRVDPSYYKDPKSGMVWTAFAGPLANFLLSFGCIFLLMALLRFGYLLPDVLWLETIIDYLGELLNYTALLSLGQAIFNMIPVPPLDGSKIIAGLLPDHIYEWFLRNEQLLSMLIFVLLFTNIINGPLLQLRNTIFNGMAEIAFGILF